MGFSQKIVSGPFFHSGSHIDMYVVAMCITCDVNIDTNKSSKGTNAYSGPSFCLQLLVVTARRCIGKNPSEDFQRMLNQWTMSLCS